jgi:hypothetical protein
MEVIMGQVWNWRTVRIAMLAAAVALPLGSVALGQPAGQYDYDDRHDEAREQGYRNGYRDGIGAGQRDRDRGRRFKFKNDDWEDSRGYEHWMGNHGQYKQAYREGYERGYRRGFGSDYDRDGRRDHDRDDWR